MRYIRSLILISVLTTMPSVSVYSQSPPIDGRVHRWQVTCQDTDTLNKTLEGKFGESLIMRGEGVQEDYFELWADKNGEYTIVISPFEGMPCVAFFGSALRLMQNLGPEL